MGIRKVIILGATGSIGDSALKIIRKYRELFQVVGISFHSNHEKAAGIIQEFHVSHVFCSDLTTHNDTGAISPRIIRHNSYADLLSIDYDLVIIAVVGAAGVHPAYIAASQGKRILLANKESLVIAGNLIMQTANVNNSQILPVDSEHNSIYRLLKATKDFKKITITASGGALRNWKSSDLGIVKVEDVLNHPTWSMGSKVTVDSATMVNKALEVIEATHLFDLDFSEIDAVIHPESYVHAILKATDGSSFFHVYKPNMIYSIAFCLFYPDPSPEILVSSVSSEYPALTFYDIDRIKYPAYYLGIEAGRQGGIFPAVFNAANEEAVRLFLKNIIPYTDINTAISEALSHCNADNFDESFDGLMDADNWARNFVGSQLV